MDIAVEIPMITVESPLNTLQLPPEPALTEPTETHIVRWNPETAKLAALKSIETRRAKKLAPKPDQLKPVRDPYIIARLESVRTRMKQFDDLMAKECLKGSDDESLDMPDAQRLDRLASAWSKLAEQERILDGRPLPGSRKPGVEKAPKQTFSEPQ